MPLKSSKQNFYLFFSVLITPLQRELVVLPLHLKTG